MSDLTMEEKIEKFKNNEYFKFKNENELKDFLYAIKADETLLMQFKEKYISKLPLTFQRVLTMHYFESKRTSEIAKIEGLSDSAISIRLKRALKQLRLIMENESAFTTNAVAEHMPQTKVINKMQKILNKYKDKINFETELLPYLSEDHKKVFLKYIQNNNGEMATELSKSLNRHNNYTECAVRFIITKLENIIQKKQEIEEFYKKIGGKDQLEDIKLFLSDKEKTYIDKYVLNASPDAWAETRDALGFDKTDDRTGTLKKRVDIKIDKILEKKQAAKEFIEANGGENFLLYEFGNTLDDAHFEVLINVLMDYHYLSKEDVSEALESSTTTAIESSILKKLNDYHARKKEIDKLIENAGGADKVISEIYDGLNETEKIVFLEHTIAYLQPTMREIAKKIGKSAQYVNYTSANLLQKLQDMAAANQKA